MNLIDMKQDQKAALDKAEAIVTAAEQGRRNLTAEESTGYQASMTTFRELGTTIKAREEMNTVWAALPGYAPVATSVKSSIPSIRSFSEPGSHPKAEAFRNQFGAWMNNGLSALGGGTPRMEATAPSGPISVGTTSGWDSIGITVPTEILPYLPSYYALDSFGIAGATTLYTDHTRPLVKPILSAGAADSLYAENAAPTTSQPLGLSEFTFGGTKYARLVLASYESLMNSEIPLQGALLDELLASLATTLTAATTTLMNTALTGASSTLEVGTGGSNDIYSSLIDLRHAVPPRFDLPTNKFMLSRATLATIRNKRASTSGVAMFDPNAGTIFDRPYVINDNFDSVCGAGFVVFGDWSTGCQLRRTPVQTRVFLELFANNGQIGYRTQQWADAHFLAELIRSDGSH